MCIHKNEAKGTCSSYNEQCEEFGEQQKVTLDILEEANWSLAVMKHDETKEKEQLLKKP